MPSPAEAVSLLVALEFVLLASILLLTVPFEAVVGVVPLFVLFVVALLYYRS